MKQRKEHSPDAAPSIHLDRKRSTWLRLPRIVSSSEILRDVIAGVLASVILIANIISFGGLMFPGDLSPGMA